MLLALEPIAVGEASASGSASGASTMIAAGRASASTSASGANARIAAGRSSASTSASGARARSAAGRPSASISASGAHAKIATGVASASTSASRVGARLAAEEASASIRASGAGARSARSERRSPTRTIVHLEMRAAREARARPGSGKLERPSNLGQTEGAATSAARLTFRDRSGRLSRPRGPCSTLLFHSPGGQERHVPACSGSVQPTLLRTAS